MASDAVATKQQENASAFTFQKYIESGGRTMPTFKEIASIYPNVNAQWMRTFEEQAIVLKGYLKYETGYSYSRDTGIMPFLEQIAKTYCGVEGGSRIFATKDTWNPMDIVMVKKSQESSIMRTIQELVTIEGMTERGNLTLLNSIMYESLKSKDMIPISLKAIKLSAGVDLEEELNSGNPENKEWDVIGAKCLVDIKDRNFVNSELSFQFQLKDPPKYVISAQVRNKRLSQPNGTVQIECINKSKPAAKLGGVPASFLEKYLESIGASKPISIAKHPNIPREFPGNWTESQLSYWINLLQSLQGAAIGGENIEFGTLSVSGQGADTSGAEAVIRNGALNEQVVDRANNGRFRNILVCLEYAKTFSSLQPEALEGLLNVMYYGAKKTFDPLNGSFVKIF